MKDDTKSTYISALCYHHYHLLSSFLDIFLEISGKVPPAVDLFITADSSYGSSVDDISAEHVNYQLLIFFGDSSPNPSSSTSSTTFIPIITLPFRKHINLDDLIQKISANSSLFKGGSTSIDLMSCTTTDIHSNTLEVIAAREAAADAQRSSVLLICHPCYTHAIEALRQHLQAASPATAIIAAIPAHSPLSFFHQETSPSRLLPLPPTSTTSDNLAVPRSQVDHTHTPHTPLPASLTESLGGMLVPSWVITDPSAAAPAPVPVLYIGSKGSRAHLVSFLLRMSSHTFVCFDPSRGIVSEHTGQACKEFRERYVNVVRAKEANCIGLVVGSMVSTVRATRGGGRGDGGRGMRCYSGLEGK